MAPPTAPPAAGAQSAAIGSLAGYIPPPLLRLVLSPGIYRLPCCDWFWADTDGALLEIKVAQTRGNKDGWSLYKTSSPNNQLDDIYHHFPFLTNLKM
eukprot:2430066-Pyramimonas_sp.AAC.1